MLPSWSEIRQAFSNDIQAQRDRFVRFGISPNYKWIKLHFGHRAMNFSKFTLANLNFYGVGAELTPGKWNLSFMRGRTARAEPIDLSLVEPSFPRYQRNGWGAKLGYGTNNSSIEGIIYRGSDDLESIDIPDRFSTPDLRLSGRPVLFFARWIG